jgi:hypothetical protein
MTMCDTVRVMSPIRPTSPKTGAETVREFLETDAGRKLVHSTLHRSHLSKNLADDLMADVLYAAVRMDRRGDSIQSIEAWANTALARRATDLCRGEIRERRFRERALDEAGVHDRPGVHYAHDVQAAPEAFDDMIVQQHWAHIRRVLCRGELSLSGGSIRPWELSASLTFIGVRGRGLVTGDGRVPVHADVDGYRHCLHVGLWYAGQRDCFADEDGQDSPAVRKRRSRRSQDVANLLALLPKQIEGVSQ